MHNQITEFIATVCQGNQEYERFRKYHTRPWKTDQPMAMTYIHDRQHAAFSSRNP